MNPLLIGAISATSILRLLKTRVCSLGAGVAAIDSDAEDRRRWLP